jgi:2-haloacid dehalogenase
MATIEASPTTPVFDIGNVLIRWDPACLYSQLLPDAGAVSGFLAEVDFHGWNREQDRGRDIDVATEWLVSAYPHYATLIRAYRARFQETIPGAIPETVELLQALRARGPVYAITNYNQTLFRETQDRFPFLRQFTDVVVSGAEQLLKPDPRIYRMLLERNGLRADDCLFIDDVPENVDGARAVGMHAVQFTTPAALHRALQAHGML